MKNRYAFMFSVLGLVSNIAAAADFRAVNDFIRETFELEVSLRSHKIPLSANCGLRYAPSQNANDVPGLSLHRIAANQSWGDWGTFFAVESNDTCEMSWTYDNNGQANSVLVDCPSKSCEEEGCVEDLESFFLSKQVVRINSIECLIQ